MGVALMMVTALGAGYLAFLAYVAWKNREYARSTRLAKWVSLCLGVYMVVLLAFSVISKDRVAGGGEEVRFCGFDPACDLSAGVIQVRKVKTLGNPPRELMAEGMFFLVTVKVTSATARPLPRVALTGVVADGHGGEYPQFRQGESTLESERTRADTTGRPAGPVGTHRKVMVFDLPANVEKPALVLHEGTWLERLLEQFVIGDEASLLHGKTKLLLELPERRP